jgi:hypothetical protein
MIAVYLCTVAMWAFQLGMSIYNAQRDNADEARACMTRANIFLAALFVLAGMD